MTLEAFSKLVKKASGYVSTYPFLVPVELGHYYHVGSDGELIHLENLLEWPGWRDAVGTHSAQVSASETFYAGCKRVFEANASAGVTPVAGVRADASVTMEFSQDSGFVLAHQAARRNYVKDVPALQRAIVQLAKDKRWEPSWVLVFETMEASSATVLVSRQASSSIRLDASVTVPKALEMIGVADPNLGWKATNWNGDGYTYLCQAATPLFHCLKAHKTLFGRTKAELLGADDDDLDEFFVKDDPFAD